MQIGQELYDEIIAEYESCLENGEYDRAISYLDDVKNRYFIDNKPGANGISGIIDKIHELLANKNDEVKFSLLLADIYLSDFSYSKAFNVLLDYLDKGNNDVRVWEKLSYACGLSGDCVSDLNYRAIRKLLDVDPNNPTYLLWMALYHKRSGNYKKGYDYIEKAINMDPNNYMLWTEYYSFFHQISDNRIGHLCKEILERINDVKILEIFTEICRGNKIQMRIYEKMIALEPSNGIGYAGYGDYYYRLGRFNKAKELYIKAIDNDDHNSQYWTKLGKAFFELHDNDGCIRACKAACECSPEDPRYFFFLMVAYYKATLFDMFEDAFTVFINQKKLDYHWLLELLNMPIPADDLARQFEKITPIYKTDRWSLLHENINMNQIILATRNMINKGKLRYWLFFLYKYTMDLKNYLRWEESGKKGYDVCHYSTIGLLRNIVGTGNDQQNGPFFRLYNASYMNDPAEGSIFLELISKHHCKDDNMISTQQSGKLVNSNVYIGSFTKLKDKLPLWVQYGDNGKGCCIVFDSSLFANIDSNDRIRIDGSKNDNDGTHDSIKHYCLYKVIYVCDAECSGEIDGYVMQISKAISALSKMDEYDLIKSIVYNIIDHVRYLFKDKSYEHEQEVRVVVSDHMGNALTDYNPNFRIPRLYLNMKKKIRIKEAVLGPKVEKVSEFAPFLYSSKLVDSVSVSTIKYQ